MGYSSLPVLQYQQPPTKRGIIEKEGERPTLLSVVHDEFIVQLGPGHVMAAPLLHFLSKRWDWSPHLKRRVEKKRMTRLLKMESQVERHARDAREGGDPLSPRGLALARWKSVPHISTRMWEILSEEHNANQMPNQLQPVHPVPEPFMQPGARRVSTQLMASSQSLRSRVRKRVNLVQEKFNYQAALRLAVALWGLRVRERHLWETRTQNLIFTQPFHVEGQATAVYHCISHTGRRGYLQSQSIDLLPSIFTPPDQDTPLSDGSPRRSTVFFNPVDLKKLTP